MMLALLADQVVAPVVNWGYTAVGILVLVAMLAGYIWLTWRILARCRRYLVRSEEHMRLIEEALNRIADSLERNRLADPRPPQQRVPASPPPHRERPPE